LKIRPGITSPASVAYRSEEAMLTGAEWEREYIQHVLPAKLAIDLAYARKHSLGKDARIILLTIWAIIVHSS
jgi:lipopolysaccharide/colanic/teichoic acid biosynthesis glycosyltransferase